MTIAYTAFRGRIALRWGTVLSGRVTRAASVFESRGSEHRLWKCFRVSCFIVVVTASVTAATAADLQVVSVEPAAHTVVAPRNSAIVVHFDKPVNPASVTALNSFWAFGRWSGTVNGAFSFSNGDKTVTLTPARPFSGGEQVMVILSHDIEATDGTTLRPGGYSFQFWARAAFASTVFVEIGVLNTIAADGISPRPYGGIASDLNGDGFLDLTAVNEDTADLRVFLNAADGTGLFDPFLQQTFDVGNRASPSEPSDFNRDGVVDVCVANINDNTVSVLLGNGDGTFAAQQVIGVGLAPRGITVLDVDGDGDIDIVNTNSGSGEIHVLLNDGSGVFAAQTPFNSGGLGVWALAAADMNDDGLLDLIIGARGSGEVIIQTGNGTGGFVFASARSGVGDIWMLNFGDVDGNGTEDVAVVTPNSDMGVILLGDGAGNLGPPHFYPTDDFPLATDLGDLDGDGDLDWVTSSFRGDWRLYKNDGAGNFTFDQEFAAPDAASCCLIFDFDNDNDLDLALIDENVDVILLMENTGSLAIPTLSAWGVLLLALGLVAAGTVVVARQRSSGERRDLQTRAAPSTSTSCDRP